MATTKTQIPPSRWWTLLARPLVRDYAAGFVQLSKELAKKTGRAKPWSHAALSRFVATGQCSADLAQAISVFFKIPRPAFLARSFKEASEMEAVASKYEDVKISEIEAEIIELQERLAAREQQLELEASRAAHPKQTRRARS